MSRAVLGSEVGLKVLEALGLEHETGVLTITMRIALMEPVTVTVERYADAKAVDGLVKVLHDYELHEREETE